MHMGFPMNIHDSTQAQFLSSPIFTNPLGDQGAVNAVNAQSRLGDQRELLKAAKQYEAFFVSYLMKVMRETVHESEMSGKMGSYFYSFYDQEIGNRASESGGIGITQMVKEYIDKNYPPTAKVSDDEHR
ncbi:MAG: Peptidoglycan hydrolase FlgJ (Modular protein) [Nitrospira sp.]|nr:MAG: Peptidoglycan hydrolase FlgJ (Modular protein) [Nitrospira sp.]